ncbi:MAG: tetratricopeptide repeat protein [Bacteroidia bacterium]|nr:tetratricopeptide repeat protein [Bacteroidia bacterium]
MKNVIFLAVLLLFEAEAVFSQKTSNDLSPANAYEKGLELYRDGKYGSAQVQFNNSLQNADPTSNAIHRNFEQEAAYYNTLCALNLYHSNTEKLLMNYLKDYPSSPRISHTHFNLGRLYFRQKRHTNVIQSLRKVNIYHLDNHEMSELYFKLGYSHFKKRDYKEANRAFFEIKDLPNKYSYPANYYYGYSAYMNGNYAVALESFIRIKDVEAYSKVIPYYIAQIYFLQKDYPRLISYGNEALRIHKLKNENRIQQLIAQAYYEMEDYKMAAKHFEEYITKERNITPNDIYQFGFSLYKIKKYKKAAFAFEQIIDGNDNLAQNALFFLGSCNLKAGNKRDARIAFSNAAKLDFDQSIKENSEFYYAKLSFELAYHQVAVLALQEFINKYPDSKNADEGREILSNVFLSTKNYKDALPLLAAIKKRTRKIDEAHQKVAYYRGIELYNRRKYDTAIKLFNLSLKFPKNDEVKSLSHFWKAESYYKLNAHAKSIDSYLDFFSTKGVEQNKQYQIANYNLAYNYFKKENYRKALRYYKEYIGNAENDNSPPVNDPLVTRENLVNDAIMRSADCSFILKKYDDAVKYYNQVIIDTSTGTDYALFQKALILGLQNNPEGKIKTMYDVVNAHSESPYVDDALYEIGNTYLVINMNGNAIDEYTNIIKNHPNSSYIKNSLLNLGLINYNNGNDKEALEHYKEVVAQYPRAKEAKEAISGIKNIYVALGDVDKYIKYVEDSVPFASVGISEQDSITYEAAELRYMKGNCEKSIGDFANYLTKFPEGYFATNAHFYKAECEYKTGNNGAALEDYKYITELPRNIFTEKSLYHSASINFAFKNYIDALLNYESLEDVAEYKKNIVEARLGKMKCHFYLGNNQLAILNANKVLMYNKSSEDALTAAHHYLGKAALSMDSLDIAKKEFTITKASLSEMGAEAHYNLALIEYKKENYEISKDIIFELNSRRPPVDYWLAKGFILLALDYVKQNDFFQAKHTLQSIIDNYSGNDEIISIAKTKLEETKVVEQNWLESELSKKETTDEELEIPLPDSMDIETDNNTQNDLGLLELDNEN